MCWEFKEGPSCCKFVSFYNKIRKQSLKHGKQWGTKLMRHRLVRITYLHFRSYGLIFVCNFFLSAFFLPLLFLLFHFLNHSRLLKNPHTFGFTLCFSFFSKGLQSLLLHKLSNPFPLLSLLLFFFLPLSTYPFQVTLWKIFLQNLCRMVRL